ncbi:AAA family ATPase [Marinobacter sp. LN3S78]|uniref:AAA family ATPase n=1 Tax=Marinobacter sp. LN3S78 TaxID=3382300 RepID=UPI00387B1427
MAAAATSGSCDGGGLTVTTDSVSRGFLLGKFMPFHEGHAYLCEVAAGLVDQLTVLVCTRDCEPIPGHLRFEWVQNSVPSNVRVIHLHRDIPQEPKDHPRFWDIWRDAIRECHPEPIHRVFGSESYVHRLAGELGASPFVLDQRREAIPVSATSIRENASANWRYIPVVVRPYYQKRVCVLGAESTGKTELCKRLSAHFNTMWVPEFGRTFDAMRRGNADWTEDELIALAGGHTRSREALAKRAGPLYFEDTDLIQTLVWAEYLLGRRPTRLETLLQGWQPANHYLLMDPGVPWVDDGTRYDASEETRWWFHRTLKARLESLALGYTEVRSQGWDPRFHEALSILALP